MVGGLCLFPGIFIWALVIVVGLLILPVLVYLCVKMGTLGYLRAHVRFNQLQEKEKVDNG